MKVLKAVLCCFLIFSAVTAAEKKPVNALIHEESPYLQQHAHNPVHWMPWGEAAFEKARKENKPIFLSIGYSTCHWCHVMEEESFENPEVAKILNRYFVAIKVDREERPEIDRYYQTVHRLITRRAGGWPLTILLTPDRKPFFAATYIPREEKYGQTGLLKLLKSVAATWSARSAEIRKYAEKVERAVEGIQKGGDQGKVAPEKLQAAERFVHEARDGFDPLHGGWGGAPKFPRAATIVTLLQLGRLPGTDRSAMKMALESLDAMAKGGIYDQVEGGFFRYSTDARWRIPHFEKMLYTNAELIEAYALAARLTEKPEYRRIVRETVEDLLAHYRDRSGLFYGASDADSLDPDKGEKEEGYYFSYDYGDTLEALQKAGFKRVEERMKAYGMSPGGNLPDFRNHLYRTGKVDLELRKALDRLRKDRPYPFIDTKILCSWNALLAHSLFVATPLDDRYRRLGLEVVDSILVNLVRDGRLYHQMLPGKTPRVPALLEDYSFLVSALIDAYEASLNENYLQKAQVFLNKARELFYRKGQWMDAVGNFSNPLNLEGGSYRSALAVLADDYLRLATLAEEPSYQEAAREILERNGAILTEYPTAAPTAVLDSIAMQKGYIVVKGPKEQLPVVKSELEQKLDYPFLLFKAVTDPLYQACRVDRCFVYDKDLGTFEKKLEEILK